MTSRRILTSSSNCTSRKEEEGEMKGKSLCLLTLKLDIVLCYETHPSFPRDHSVDSSDQPPLFIARHMLNRKNGRRATVCVPFDLPTREKPEKIEIRGSRNDDPDQNANASLIQKVSKRRRPAARNSSHGKRRGDAGAKTEKKRKEKRPDRAR